LSPSYGFTRGPAVAGAIAPSTTKIDGWASLKHLVELQLRSKAPQLKTRLAAALALVLFGNVLGVWAPLLMGHAINDLARGKGTAEQVAIAFTGFIISWSVVRLFSTLAPSMRDVIFTPISQAAQARAQHETFAHAMSLSMDFHQSKQTGSLARIIDRGARSMDFLLRSFVFNLGPTFIQLVLSAVVLTSRFGWRFAVCTVITITAYVAFTLTISDWRIAHRRVMNEADAKAAGISVDALINYETVKSFGSEDRSAAAYDEALQTYARAAVKANTSMAFLNAGQTIVMNIGLTVMAVMAGVDAAHGKLGPGDVTAAFVGPSGAGKTTMVKLAMRLLDPEEGAIRIDGVDLRQVRGRSLRRAVALVPQDVALFNTTLAVNIGFAKPGATDAEIRAAADAAELGGFIEGLPKGLETQVGERGLKLSGGERQRVGIARALLANPRVLVLDEATSALDSRTEEAIQHTLKRARQGRTTLVVAHRLSTIVDADEIVVLKKGHIVERGTHESLLAQGGEYATLWRRQTRKAVRPEPA
jgi:ABC-type transport system involved in Fe-S cluster assembly fused permease/ATPase subunit